MKVLTWFNDKFEETTCVFLFMTFSAIMILNAFMRFALSNAIPWASDLVLFIFIWFVWFAISYGFRKDSHVNVTVVVGFLPPPVRKWLTVATNVLTLVGFAILLYAGVELLFNRSVVGKTGLLIKYPMWSLYLATPVGLVLSMIRIVQNSLRLFRARGTTAAGEGDY